ncbi:hypothetical protein [Nocardioides sp.]|uniref:hypothetical protein n=1 Tax=Nocardioides sp. TaxID=35761 RepID=UPI00356A879B
MAQPAEDPASHRPVPYGPPQGLEGSLEHLDVVSAAVVLPTPSTVERLAPAPRPVPVTYRLACFDAKWFELITVILLVAIAVPLAASHLAMALAPLTAASLLVVAFRVRRYRRRMALLRWGEVATVSAFSPVTGRFGSSTTYSNVRLRSARGWSLDRSSYSGSGFTTDVAYTLDGFSGTVRVRGRAYEGDVVLADSRRPEHAVAVRDFPHDLTPGPDGRWPGDVPTGVWAGIVITIAMEASLLVGTALMWMSAVS